MLVSRNDHCWLECRALAPNTKEYRSSWLVHGSIDEVALPPHTRVHPIKVIQNLFEPPLGIRRWCVHGLCVGEACK